MSESPLLTSAKNNPLAREGCRLLDGGHDNTCPLALATAHCLASSRLGWTHHSLDLLGGGGIVLSWSPAAVSWNCVVAIQIVWTQKEKIDVYTTLLCRLLVFSLTLWRPFICAWVSVSELMNLWFTQYLDYCMCCSLIGCVIYKTYKWCRYVHPREKVPFVTISYLLAYMN